MVPVWLVPGEFGSLPEHGEVRRDAFARFVAVAVPCVVRAHMVTGFGMCVVEELLAAEVEKLAFEDVLQVVAAVVVVVHVLEHLPIPPHRQRPGSRTGVHQSGVGQNSW
jgi:hypothetical protein